MCKVLKAFKNGNNVSIHGYQIVAYEFMNEIGFYTLWKI
jgi:hypothetical protein